MKIEDRKDRRRKKDGKEEGMVKNDEVQGGKGIIHRTKDLRQVTGCSRGGM